MDQAGRRRLQAGAERQRARRPAVRERGPLAAPGAHDRRRAGGHEIGAIGADAGRQLAERLLDVAVELVRAGVDEARRHAGGDALEGGTALQRQGPSAQPQPEMHQQPDQHQRRDVQQQPVARRGVARLHLMRHHRGPQGVDLLVGRQVQQARHDAGRARQHAMDQAAMGQQRLEPVGAAGSFRDFEPVEQDLELGRGRRRRIAGEAQHGGRQPAERRRRRRLVGARHAQPTGEHREIGERVLEQRIAALEALDQRLLLAHQRLEPVERGRGLLVEHGDRVEARERGVEAVGLAHQAIIVAQHAGARDQHVAAQRALQHGEAVERAERLVVARRIQIHALQQQPGEQQQQDRRRRGAHEPHGPTPTGSPR